MTGQRLRAAFRRPALRFAIVAVCVAGALACQFDPYTASYATSKPKMEDLIGPWRATDATTRDLSKGSYSKLKPKIVLAADGSIRMSEIPDTWRSPFGQGHGQAQDFAGKWKLDHHQDRWWGLLLDDGHMLYLGQLMVMENRAPHLLVLRYGDPDNGDGYEFERAVEQ